MDSTWRLNTRHNLLHHLKWRCLSLLIILTHGCYSYEISEVQFNPAPINFNTDAISEDATSETNLMVMNGTLDQQLMLPLDGISDADLDTDLNTDLNTDLDEEIDLELVDLNEEMDLELVELPDQAPQLVLDEGPPSCALNTPCDDGDLCTHSDQCDHQGVCRGVTLECVSSVCVTRTCDGTSTCSESMNNGTSCDDGQQCTHHDECQAGQCSGRSISCVSDECVTRTCNGTNQCATTTHSGRTCGAPTGSCKRRTCSSSGSCRASNLADGLQCGSASDVCCSGSCVNISSDRAHCGGCGLSCFGTIYTCISYRESGLCACTGNTECRNNGQVSSTCYNPGGGARCNCQANADCAAGQTCMIIPGHNYCVYE